MDRKFFWIRLALAVVMMQVSLAHAQSKELSSSFWELSAAVTANKKITTDQTFSALPASGFQAGAGISISYSGGRLIHLLNGDWSGGKQRSKNNSLLTVQQRSLGLHYNILYAIKGASGASLQFKPGAAIDFEYNQRHYTGFINKDRSFDFATSLSGSFQLSWSLQRIVPGLIVSDNLKIAFLAAVLVPDFEKEDVPTDNMKTRAVLNDSHLLTPGSYQRFENCLMLRKAISAQTRLEFSYSWKFYTIEELAPIRQANHQLCLAITFVL